MLLAGTMIVGIAVTELHLPGVRSLKQKRKIVKGLIERIHHRLRVSIAETDFHDLHQRSEIAIAIVSRNETEVQRLLDSIRNLIDEVGPELIVTRWDPEILEASAY